MPTTTLTSKGQVTIPKKIREQLDLRPGDTLNFTIETEDTIVVRPERKSGQPAYGILYREKQESFSPEDIASGVADYFKKSIKSHDWGRYKSFCPVSSE